MGEVHAQAAAVTFEGEGVGLALPGAVPGEDQPAGVPEVGAEGKVRAVRKLRIQAAGRLGSTSPSAHPRTFLGGRSRARHEPLRRPQPTPSR